MAPYGGFFSITRLLAYLSVRGQDRLGLDLAWKNASTLAVHRRVETHLTCVRVSKSVWIFVASRRISGEYRLVNGRVLFEFIAVQFDSIHMRLMRLLFWQFQRIVVSDNVLHPFLSCASPALFLL